MTKRGKLTKCSQVQGNKKTSTCLFNSALLMLNLWHYPITFFFFFYFNTLQIQYISKTFPLPCLPCPFSLSVCSPLLPGKWLYPVEWLCKGARTGFKLSPAKRKKRKKKDKEEGRREKIHYASLAQTPNALALCKRMTHHPALYMNVRKTEAQLHTGGNVLK